MEENEREGEREEGEMLWPEKVEEVIDRPLILRVATLRNNILISLLLSCLLIDTQLMPFPPYMVQALSTLQLHTNKKRYVTKGGELFNLS